MLRSRFVEKTEWRGGGVYHLVQGRKLTCDHDPHELWNIAGGRHKIINFFLKFYLHFLEENMARKGVIEIFVEFLFVYMLIHHGISI